MVWTLETAFCFCHRFSALTFIVTYFGFFHLIITLVPFRMELDGVNILNNLCSCSRKLLVALCETTYLSP